MESDKQSVSISPNERVLIELAKQVRDEGSKRRVMSEPGLTGEEIDAMFKRLKNEAKADD